MERGWATGIALQLDRRTPNQFNAVYMRVSASSAMNDNYKSWGKNDAVNVSVRGVYPISFGCCCYPPSFCHGITVKGHKSGFSAAEHRDQSLSANNDFSHDIIFFTHPSLRIREACSVLFFLQLALRLENAISEGDQNVFIMTNDPWRHHEWHHNNEN